jgi:hypothetical protein
MLQKKIFSVACHIEYNSITSGMPGPGVNVFSWIVFEKFQM